MSATCIELGKSVDNYDLACRGCLSQSGDMKDIFKLGLAADFEKFTDLKLKQTDMSHLLCAACEDILGTCRKFREQCQNSDLLFKDLEKKKLESGVLPLTKPEENVLPSLVNTISCVLYDKELVFTITAPDMNSKIYLSCPYCSENYIKQKDLLRHLSMNHIEVKDLVIKLRYYCSHDPCSYYINSRNNKYFESRKYLNQHYVKVHMNKIFHCEVCSSSFATVQKYNQHLKSCNVIFKCEICDVTYKNNERLLVHLMRKHPNVHKEYKEQRKMLKRKSKNENETKKQKLDEKLTYICDSPKRSSATQTLLPEDNIKNDVALPSWHREYEIKTDDTSTQTMFEDLLSLKSQTSEDESIFFSETVSLSDIQTQTFPLEFGLSRSNKETITSETQSPDLSIKETQTCVCLYDSPKMNFRLFDSMSSSPSSLNLTSTETQTQELRSTVKSDVLLSFNSAETQTSFDDGVKKDAL